MPDFISQPVALSLATFLLAGATASAATNLVAERTEERFIPNYTAGEISYLWSTRADLDAFAGTDLQVQEAAIKAPVPLYRSDTSRLVTGLDFRWSSLDFDGPPVLADQLDLYRVQVPVGLSGLGCGGNGCGGLSSSFRICDATRRMTDGCLGTGGGGR